MDIILGDEFTLGYDGEHTSGIYFRKIGQIINSSILNESTVGASISGNRANDLTNLIKRIDFKGYQAVILAYGSNDYKKTNTTLDVITKDLVQSVNYIQTANPKIKIYGILPIDRYDHERDHRKIKGKGNYTFKDLITLLNLTYENLMIPCLNWGTVYPPILTNLNFKRKLVDHQVYPTRHTYERMAQNIGQFIKHH